MKARFGMLVEGRPVAFDAFRALDPGLVASRQILMPPGMQDPELTAFLAAADDGDIAQMLRLGSLSDVPTAEQWSQPLILRHLYAMWRREYVTDVTSREVGKLNDLLRKISQTKRAYGTVSKLTAAVALGDPIGCPCEPSKTHWHSEANRFDLVAYDILGVNGLREPVAAQLASRPPAGVEPDVAAAWATLLQSDLPYPVWQE